MKVKHPEDLEKYQFITIFTLKNKPITPSSNGSNAMLSNLMNPSSMYSPDYLYERMKGSVLQIVAIDFPYIAATLFENTALLKDTNTSMNYLSSLLDNSSLKTNDDSIKNQNDYNDTRVILDIRKCEFMLLNLDYVKSLLGERYVKYCKENQND